MKWGVNMRDIFVLVACEESQRVCIAFRNRGFQAYSADIQEPSGGHPEWHIKGDVLPLLNGNCEFVTMDGVRHTIRQTWDLIIAHPPCTYLTNASAVRMRVNGVIVQDRWEKAMEAKEFFMAIYNARCEHIAIENPTPMKIIGLPNYTQAIQPYEHGHPYSKRTCLWIKNLPMIKPTKICYHHEPWVNGGSKNSDGSYRTFKGRNERDAKTRSKTFIGIAEAFSRQWGDFLHDTYK